MITQHYVKVTECGLAHDWPRLSCNQYILTLQYAQFHYLLATPCEWVYYNLPIQTV